MRLSWHDIRARARVFSEDWKDVHYEKGETQPFYEKFLDTLGALPNQQENHATDAPLTTPDGVTSI
jgi:hypothetical protein